MSKFLTLAINFLLYDSTTASNDPGDAEKLNNVLSDTAVTASSRQSIALANGATNQAVTLPANPTTMLIISCDQQISAAINGAAAQVLTPITGGKKNTVYYARGTITSLSLSNSSGSTANVDVIAVVG